MKFIEQALAFVHPHNTVLDLGAGDGSFAQACADRQAYVIAVDMKTPASKGNGIDWKITDIREYIAQLGRDDKFDIIFSRNLIQFLDFSWVTKSMLPILSRHLVPGGIIAVQTFYHDPETSFQHPVDSLYTAQSIFDALPGFEVIMSKKFEHFTGDRQGVPRQFFITSVIAKKP